MIRQVFFFFVLWGLAWLFLSTRHHWSARGALSLGKAALFGGLAALIASIVLAVIVILF